MKHFIPVMAEVRIYNCIKLGSIEPRMKTWEKVALDQTAVEWNLVYLTS